MKLTLSSCGFSSSVFMLFGFFGGGRGSINLSHPVNVILTAKRRSPEENLHCFPGQSQFEFTVVPLKKTFLSTNDN